MTQTMAQVMTHVIYLGSRCGTVIRVVTRVMVSTITCDTYLGLGHDTMISVMAYMMTFLESLLNIFLIH